ncbi:MAG TPA: SpvB/TcaC N-terminal domain-containing protein [Puia sp.]|nr:SpvB/TcaC N-terminal domain-containing protein [Puia sp.]
MQPDNSGAKEKNKGRDKQLPSALNADRGNDYAKTNLLEIPSISIPKGGGALKSTDEKFQVNAANGTASFNIAIPLSKSRTDFAPSLSLNYNSGGGNSPFGLGWNINLLSIRRRTDKLLPQYRDADKLDANPVLVKSLDLVYEYFDHQPELSSAIQTIPAENRINIPEGLSASYQFTDLYNEGIAGKLSEQSEGWYYNSNLGGGLFTSASLIAPKPSFTGLNSGGLQLQSLTGDGRKFIVSTVRPNLGYFELTDDSQRWLPFVAFDRFPAAWGDPFEVRAFNRRT